MVDENISPNSFTLHCLHQLPLEKFSCYKDVLWETVLKRQQYKKTKKKYISVICNSINQVVNRSYASGRFCLTNTSLLLLYVSVYLSSLCSL